MAPPQGNTEHPVPHEVAPSQPQAGIPDLLERTGCGCVDGRGVAEMLCNQKLLEIHPLEAGKGVHREVQHLQTCYEAPRKGSRGVCRSTAQEKPRACPSFGVYAKKVLQA